jgi:pimeloyl-ACP methyl ester carboxylesterase
MKAPPFLLLHGGRHGGWCWQRVATHLRQAGHDVYTPTFTGLGERSHLLRPDIGLSTHIEDVVNLVEFEGLEDVIVVAHSYGGMPMAGAMAHIADRVRTLVFVDALMPRTGESLFDIIGPERTEGLLAHAVSGGQPWLLPVGEASEYGITDPTDLAWVNSKLSAQPLGTYRDPVGPTDRAWALPGTYLECQPSAMVPSMLERAQVRSRDDDQFSYRVLKASHDAMVTAPGLLSEVLLEAVEPA